MISTLLAALIFLIGAFLILFIYALPVLIILGFIYLFIVLIEWVEEKLFDK